MTPVRPSLSWEPGSPTRSLSDTGDQGAPCAVLGGTRQAWIAASCPSCSAGTTRPHQPVITYFPRPRDGPSQRIELGYPCFGHEGELAPYCDLALGTLHGSSYHPRFGHEGELAMQHGNGLRNLPRTFLPCPLNSILPWPAAPSLSYSSYTSSWILSRRPLPRRSSRVHTGLRHATLLAYLP